MTWRNGLHSSAVLAQFLKLSLAASAARFSVASILEKCHLRGKYGNEHLRVWRTMGRHCKLVREGRTGRTLCVAKN